MTTTHEVEQRLRHTLGAVADTTAVTDHWTELVERLDPADAIYQTLSPAPPQRRRSDPVVVFAAAFAVVVVTFGVVASLQLFDRSGSAGSSPGIGGATADQLRYVPTFLPDSVPPLSGWFTPVNGPETSPSVTLLQWAEAATTRANAGLLVWRDVGPPNDDLGPADANGFWVEDFAESEGWPWIRIHGQADEEFFIVDGTGTADRELVFTVARAVRDGQSLPIDLEEWIDVTPTTEYTFDPNGSIWYLDGQAQGRHISGRISGGIYEPLVQLASHPWQCELVSVGTTSGTLCGQGDWTLTWQIAPDATASLQATGPTRDEVVAMAESMVLMTADDPRVPPEPNR